MGIAQKLRDRERSDQENKEGRAAEIRRLIATSPELSESKKLIAPIKSVLQELARVRNHVFEYNYAEHPIMSCSLWVKHSKWVIFHEKGYCFAGITVGCATEDKYSSEPKISVAPISIRFETPFGGGDTSYVRFGFDTIPPQENLIEDWFSEKIFNIYVSNGWNKEAYRTK